MADTDSRAAQPTEYRFSVCPHDCPDTCGMVVGVRDGRAVSIHGDGSHPFTGANQRFQPSTERKSVRLTSSAGERDSFADGFLCVKVNNYLDRVYSPDRVLRPLRRVGPKGEGRFEPCSWDEALDEIAERLRAIVARDGAEAILPYSYAGTMGMLGYGSMDRRFFHRLGASLLDRTICAVAGTLGYRYTIGGAVGTDPEQFANARLILLWGTNTVSTNVHMVPFIRAAKAKGARVVLIDPHRTRTAQLADEVLLIRPGTDAALALAMMHVICRDGLIDADYVARHTLGFEQLRERVADHSPEWAAAETGLPAEAIERLAVQYATEGPAAIRINYGLQRHANGGMAVRTIACLPALVGAWRHPGGGILLSTSGSFRYNLRALERPDLISGRPRTINMVRLGEALAEADPPVRALFVYNANPAAVAPNQERVLAGLRSEELFTVVHEQVMTDTCRYADFVLPATTILEQLDVHKAYGHLYVQLSEPVIPPLGEAKPNTELFRRLARRMGFDEPCFGDSDEELVRQALQVSHPSMAGVDYERLKRDGWARLELPRPFAPFAEGGFPTPSGKCELYSERARRDGFDPLPRYDPPAEGPRSELARRYPLQLVSAAAHHFLNSTFSHVEKHRSLEGRPTIELHPDDAAARGIADGDPVRAFNDRGAARFWARVGLTVPPGVAAHSSIWWLRDSPDGRNVNALTSDRLSDMGGGATFHDNLVQIERDRG
jgi:anaerobic selenocysteine-containing dehydrogenase